MIATVYTCPMHPKVISDKAGKCAKCGMDLAKKNQLIRAIRELNSA